MSNYEQPQFPEESLQNPALARCVSAWQSRYRAALATGESKYSAFCEAHAAYRQSMPPLTSSDNIRDFVACVAHGLLIQAIESNNASRLLYAAQVAQRAFPRPPQRSTYALELQQ